MPPSTRKTELARLRARIAARERRLAERRAKLWSHDEARAHIRETLIQARREILAELPPGVDLSMKDADALAFLTSPLDQYVEIALQRIITELRPEPES
jgi:hypothetical protein